MKKNKNTYLQDIEDSTISKLSKKEAQVILSEIHHAQKKAYPTMEFKETLQERLKDIYTIDAWIEKNPKLHILRNFMMFCSFFLITWVVFMVLDSREDIFTPTEEWIYWLPDSWLDPDSWFFKALIDEANAPLIREETQEIEELVWSENKEINEDIWENEKTKIANTSESDSMSEDLSPWLQEQEEALAHDEEIAPSSTMMFESRVMRVSEEDSIQDENYNNQEMRHDMDTESSYENSEAIYMYQYSIFVEICEENDGEVAMDDYTCEFENWAYCTMDNISQNSEFPCGYLYGSGSIE